MADTLAEADAMARALYLPPFLALLLDPEPLRRLAAFALLMTCSGCSWIAWVGYDDPVRQPPPGSYEPVAGGCFSVGTQNLNNEQRRAVMGAASAVCAVFESEAFEERVAAQSWLANCDGDGGSPEVMSGDAVYAVLSERVPDFSVHPRKPWRAIAQAQKSETDHRKNRVAIRPSRISAWHAGTAEGRGRLINTTAHEITHLLSYAFRDEGHGSEACPDARLVSYGIGDLVEDLVGVSDD